jgi:hypothetical protein
MPSGRLFCTGMKSGVELSFEFSSILVGAPI